jgi:SAM-dependent methyltransferase
MTKYNSPAREYSDKFLFENLNKLVPAKEIRVLDIGCGSGYIREIFSNLGYKVRYTGVDVKKHQNFDRFNFVDSEFIQSGIEDFKTENKFDLIISVSALEHIEDDKKVIAKVRQFLKPDGVQIHIVPAIWSRPLYLKHGYRRYNPARLKKIFPQAEISGKGGLFSFFLHLFFITVPRRIFKSDRLFESNIYPKFVKISQRLDKIIPVPVLMYFISEADYSRKSGWPSFGLLERIWYKMNQVFLWHYLKLMPKTKKKYYVYYHPTRSGGTAIKYLMKKQGYANRILGLSHYRNVRNAKFRNKNIIKFSTVRNPFSWYVSLYNSKVKTSHKKKASYYPKMEKNSWQDFFNDLVLFKNGKEGIKKWHYPWIKKSAPYEIAENYNPNYGWCVNNFLHYFYPEQESVKILKVENLKEEIDSLFKDTDINLDLSKTISNVDSKKNYMDYYTLEMIEQVKQRDKIIFERFYPEKL